MIAAGIVSSVIGTMYGAFEVYKSYQDMQKKIATYVTPDLSEFDKRLAVIEENSQKTTDYTRDIKNDLKNDIRRLEKVVEQVERDGKQLSRETEQDIRNLRKEIDNKIQKAMDNPLAVK
jgi:archaellum component FlaC